MMEQGAVCKCKRIRQSTTQPSCRQAGKLESTRSLQVRKDDLIGIALFRRVALELLGWLGLLQYALSPRHRIGQVCQTGD